MIVKTESGKDLKSKIFLLKQKAKLISIFNFISKLNFFSLEQREITLEIPLDRLVEEK